MHMQLEQMTMEEIREESSTFDRLSSLPDDLLLRVMGSLTTRQAVQTCVLSKRWKNQWRYLMCLDFNCHEFSSREKFIHFVNSFFDQRSTSRVDTFRLDWDPKECLNSGYSLPELTRKWISSALEFKPQMLFISDFSRWPYYNKPLPQSLLTWASLETMELHYFLLLLTKTITFFSLKRLILFSVISDGESMTNLISGCPVLEDLVMEYCTLQNSDVTITSHSLKHLDIHYLSCKVFGIHLSIPSLTSLHVTNAILGRIWVKNMSSLVKARIRFCDNDSASYHKSSNELLSCLSNVKYLDLIGTKTYNYKFCCVKQSAVKDMLGKELPNCPVFYNLKSLYLVGDWNNSASFTPIAHFVHLSPNLETLILGHDEKLNGNLENESEMSSFRIWRENLTKMLVIKCCLFLYKQTEELRSTLKANLETMEKFDVIS